MPYGPPEVTHDEPRQRRGWLFWLGWVLFGLAVLFWIAIAISLAIRLPQIEEPGEQGRQVGRTLGIFLIPFVLVLIGRFIYVRLRRPPRPRFWSPWILVITTLFALVLAVPAALGQIESPTADLEAASYLRPLDGYEYLESPALEGRARDTFQSDPELRGSRVDVALREVARDGRTVGVVLVVGMEPADAGSEAFRSGVEEGMTQSAGQLEEVTLRGVDASYADTPDGASVYTWWHENLLVVASADDRASAEELAEALIAANE